MVLFKSETNMEYYIYHGLSGYYLYIELNPDSLCSGASYELPNQNISTYLYYPNDPFGDHENNIKGNMDVVEVKGNGVLINFDIADASSSWELNGKDLLRYSNRECEGKIDRACNFYLK